MKNKKKLILTLLAILTAVVGIAVAVGAFLRRKAQGLGEKLDYDGSLYYEDDEDALEEDETGDEADAQPDEADDVHAEEDEIPD